MQIAQILFSFEQEYYCPTIHYSMKEFLYTCNATERRKFHEQNLSLELPNQLNLERGKGASEHTCSSSDPHQKQQISM